MRLVPPMLAQLARELPEGDYLYEPKWDGFRAVALRDGDAVEIRSRHGRPLTRYFPELVEALLAQPRARFVLDGEIVATPFPALMARLHPAVSRVERLRAETPAELGRSTCSGSTGRSSWTSRSPSVARGSRRSSGRRSVSARRRSIRRSRGRGSTSTRACSPSRAAASTSRAGARGSR